MSEVNYLRRAVEFGMEHSDDPRTKIGAAVKFSPALPHLVFGANRLPEGVRLIDARISQEHKARYIEHAERDVIYACARRGIPAFGAVMYAPWFACCCCARAIIVSGIREVVGLASLHAMTPDRWSDDIAAAHQMLAEAGVGMRWLTAKIGTTILFDGKEVEI